MHSLDLPATLESLKSIAAAQVARHPQYKGHFTPYRLGRIKRDVKTKLGLAFTKGEYVIATESEPVVLASGYTLPTHVTAWSRRNACDTALKSADIEWL